jgi:archaellum component FlaC
MQTVGVTWSAATLSNNVKNTVERVETLELDLKTLPDKFITQKEHVPMQDHIQGEVDDIKEDIEKLQRRVLHIERNISPK